MRKTLAYIKRDLLAYLKRLAYKPALPKNPMHDDIYLVEFPKSGVTWLSHIVGNIELQLRGMNETVTYYNHHRYVTDIHKVGGAAIHRKLDRTFIKSHSPYNPYYYFVVYLLRNPFDVMVSYYNYMTAHGVVMDFDAFVKSQRYGIPLWKANVDGWLKSGLSDQKLHLMKYEALLIDPHGTVRDIYTEFGVTLDETVLNKAIELSDIGIMRKHEDHYRKFNPNYTLSFVGAKGKKSKDELLTDDIRTYISEQCRDILERYYPELLDQAWRK